ncbi:GIY-YIG nuclease family protein [Capnocytophaga canis]|nr:GIY-YIG nuclease family protein [Capnocytophaga canis]
MTCELSNWTGKAYKIPRVEIKLCVDRPDLKNTGVYLLLGKNEEGKEIVYIGEAENVYTRLTQHLTQKDFWNEVIIFVSKDDNLNKAHIKYLEYRLYQNAKEAKRYSIENGNTPTLSSISELDKAEMEEFIENIKLLVNTLGHKVFENKREYSSIKKREQYYIDQGKDERFCRAIGELSSEGFLVLKGSRISQEIVPSFPSSFCKLRESLIQKGTIVNFEFQEDYIFSSPSTASSVITGRSSNGLIEWKTKNGKILKEAN